MYVNPCSDLEKQDNLHFLNPKDFSNSVSCVLTFIENCEINCDSFGNKKS